MKSPECKSGPVGLEVENVLAWHEINSNPPQAANQEVFDFNPGVEDLIPNLFAWIDSESTRRSAIDAAKRCAPARHHTLAFFDVFFIAVAAYNGGDDWTRYARLASGRAA